MCLNTQLTITTKDAHYATIDAYWITLYNHGNNINIKKLTFYDFVTNEVHHNELLKQTTSLQASVKSLEHASLL